MGIVKQTDIDQILSTRHGKINKVIISLILSSGMQPKFVRDLTLNQLLMTIILPELNNQIELEMNIIDNILIKIKIFENVLEVFPY